MVILPNAVLVLWKMGPSKYLRIADNLVQLTGYALLSFTKLRKKGKENVEPSSVRIILWQTKKLKQV